MKKSLLNKEKFRVVFKLFLLFQIINFAVLFVINKISPLQKLYSFDEYSNNLLRAFGNFDGLHYYQIARHGYGLYQEAFFPLYPLIIKYTSYFTNTNFINGLIIANLSFLAFLYVFYIFFEDLIGREKTFWSLVFLILFPTSFFFGAVYTESLFLLLFMLTMLSFKKEKYLLSAIFGFLTALTRFIGIFAVVPLFVYIVLERKRLDFKKIIVLAAPIFGFLTYSTYLYIKTGDFLKFLNVQPQFGANRSTELILVPQVLYRYVKIFITASQDFIYLIAVTEFIIFIIFVLVLFFQLYLLVRKKYSLKNRKAYSWLIGLNLFSLINIILPTLTGTLSSVPRYALLSISFFITISFIESKPLKYILGLVFLILHIFYLSFFLSAMFVG